MDNILMWKRSSFCRFDSPQCTEVQGLDTEYIEVRNSRVPHTITSFDRREWQAFIDGVKAGDFDLKTDSAADASEQMDQE